MKLTPEEEKEYHILADKRDKGIMSNKEHKRWKELVNKSFVVGLPEIFKSWIDEFRF